MGTLSFGIIRAAVSCVAVLCLTNGFAAGDRPSLCDAVETPIFSCAIGSKIASLCASRDLTAMAGTIVYRYGRPGLIEMSYPDPPSPARQAFTAAVDNSPGDYVRFSRNNTTYTVFSEMIRSRDPHQEAGVIVSRGPKILATLKCNGDDDGLGRDGWKLMYAAKLPHDPTGSIDPTAQ